jgi:class 3 adenylate cyclase/pimeloyl-ACP methyl ester carboxylesterase
LSQTSGGTLTVLFTDLVSSTELLQRLGDEAADRVRRAHFRLVRDAVTARGGQEVKTLGDGLMVVFPSATDAVACAVAVQQGVHAHNARDASGPQLAVRAGLESGEPIRNEGDYFGTPVVVAKRLCDSASGGQIIVSEVVRNLIGSRGDHVFVELGTRSLKGFSEPIAVCEVEWTPAPDVPDKEPASTETALALPQFGGERTTFFGRTSEFEVLSRCWAAARGSQRKLVLLAGDPGIGKTRLATEFALRCHDEGADVMFGRADEASLVPCQPFIDAIEQYTSNRSITELRALLGPACDQALLALEIARSLPEAALGRGTESAAQQERQRLCDAFVALFTILSPPRSLVLVLDDLQWADQTSLQVLRRVMRQSRQTRLLILGTYRETDVTPDHPLGALLAGLRRDRLVERIAVVGLGERNVGSLVGAWAGQDSPAELTRTIYEQTEGNPLFVEEMLRHLTETGAMFDDDGRLREYATASGVPETVKDIIERRLARLSDECANVLTIASVIGRDFGIDALRRASGMSDEQLIHSLEEAVDVSLVREVPGAVGRYRFAHALVHEALNDELTTTRRVRIHGQTLQYADNDGVKLAYEVLGSKGPHVIAIGLSNCPAVRTRNRMTMRRWEQLAEHCRIVLYDRRGVGMSSTPERGYSMFVGVEDIRAVLDAAGVDRAVLWGATDGGPLAIAFAAHYPERVAGLLLLGTTAKYTASDDYPWGVAETAIASFLRADAVDRARAISDLSSTRQRGSGGGAGPDAIAEVFERVPRQSWRKLVMGLGAADARPMLPDVRTPTLIVHDPENTYIPVQAAHYLHEQIAGSRLVISDEWGRPLLGDELWRTIEDFIEEVRTG